MPADATTDEARICALRRLFPRIDAIDRDVYAATCDIMSLGAANNDSKAYDPNVFLPRGIAGWAYDRYGPFTLHPNNTMSACPFSSASHPGSDSRIWRRVHGLVRIYDDFVNIARLWGLPEEAHRFFWRLNIYPAIHHTGLPRFPSPSVTTWRTAGYAGQDYSVVPVTNDNWILSEYHNVPEVLP